MNKHQREINRMAKYTFTKRNDDNEHRISCVQKAELFSKTFALSLLSSFLL